MRCRQHLQLCDWRGVPQYDQMSPAASGDDNGINGVLGVRRCASRELGAQMCIRYSFLEEGGRGSSAKEALQQKVHELPAEEGYRQSQQGHCARVGPVQLSPWIGVAKPTL